MENQIDLIKIKPDFSFVEVKFLNPIVIGEDDLDDKFGFESNLRPHKDFIAALKKLRKLALETAGIVVGKEISEWSIVEIKIAGNIALKQSRVKLSLMHMVDKFKHKYKVPTPQMKMYPTEEERPLTYERIDELEKLLLAFFDEVYEYVGGKYDPSMGEQLPLYSQ